MSQQNNNDNKQNNSTPLSKGNSYTHENINEKKQDSIENQQNGFSKVLTSPSQNQNMNQLYKYQYDKLPDIYIKEQDEIQNDFDKLRQNQRSSGSLYRHNNDQMNLFNPYIQKGNRSCSQKSIPSAVILQQVKQERIVIQEQNQMLINRLRKLRQEELQIQKIADDTSKRAEKVFQQKKFYQKKREEEQQRLQQQDEIAYTQPKKQLEMMRVQIAKEEKLKEKKKGFYEVKQRIAEEQIRKANEEKAHMENIKFKMEQIKKQKEISKIKKEQYLQEKKQKVEKEIQKQYVKEEALLSFAKFEAKDFEKREQEMLERIRRTQLINEQAKEKLKDSVTLDISQFESRYLKDKENRYHKEKKNNVTHDISVSSINSVPHHKLSTAQGIPSNYNSKSISQQILKIASNGKTFITNQH